ncbi:MAG TPA: argininosuccinate lyase [Planktothrix sp.]|jgi:argininosuccinate lyase
MQVLRTAFTEQLDPAISKIVTSIEEDKELIAADIKGSTAHCAMLTRQGLLTEEQGKSICDGLGYLAAQNDQGELELLEEFEDVHMNIEKKLEKLIGDDAKRLHTARSRNDQVALDFRIYVGDCVSELVSTLQALQFALVRKANQYPHTVMPGYTHLQRAQPILFSHAMLAFWQMLDRDIERFATTKVRASISPLGAGAQAGTALEINPDFSAQVLGMHGIFANSIDAVMDRDFAVEFVMAASLCATHLSQLCETLIIWNTSEFGFIKFGDNATTSSSLMPQKKNPDPVEIVRGKTGAFAGELVNLLTTLKGLPLGYNRDLQETKAPVIRAFKTLSLCLSALSVAIDSIQVQPNAMKAAASDPDLMATDLVEYLVLKDVAFRTAHEAVAKAVQLARATGEGLSSLTLSQLQSCSPAFGTDVYALFDPLKSAAAKTSPGGTGSADAMASGKLLIT